MISFHQFVVNEATPPSGGAPPGGSPPKGPPPGGPPPGGPPMGMGGPPIGLGGPPPGGPPGLGGPPGGPMGMGGPAEGQPQAQNKVQKLSPSNVWDALKKSLKKKEDGQKEQQDV